MQYDPVKDSLGRFFQSNTFLHRIFFALLHLFFLRAWHVRKAVRKLFKSIKKNNIRILDAGTGFAQYTYFMARLTPRAEILAVDVKRDYLETAFAFFKKINLAHRVFFAFEDLTALKAKGPFDFILCVDVMEHIEDDIGVFRNFEKVMEPGGYVLINTPSDQGGSDVSEEGESSFIEEHVRDGYNLAELQKKLSDAGLEPVEAYYTYGKYGSLAWRFMIKYPIQMLGLTKWLMLLLPLYYIPVLPVGLLLHALDVHVENKTGTGVIVIARKPAA